MRKTSTKTIKKNNKEFNMKLKSILIMTMVAILAIAGGAFAATTTTNSTNADAGGTAFGGGVTLNFGGAICSSNNLVATVTCAAMTAAQATAFATDAQTGSGTGLTGGMPAQVVYSANAYGVGLGAYLSGVGPQTGYALDQTLFGMCARNNGVAGNCPKFVPNAANASANTIAGLLLATGGGNAPDGGAGTVASSTIPTGTANFNEATFITGLVSNGGNTVGTFVNGLSQTTSHHSNVVNGTGAGNGDFIDQRLAQVIGAVQTLAQSTKIGGGTAVTVTAPTLGNSNGGLIDATWVGNVDAFNAVAGGIAPATSLTPSAALYTALTGAGALVGNGGQIQQAVADSNSGGFGDYGQIFANDDVTVTNGITAPAVGQAATAYTATGVTTGVLAGTISILP